MWNVFIYFLFIKELKRLKRKVENEKPKQVLPKKIKLAENDTDDESISDGSDLDLESTDNEDSIAESDDSDESTNIVVFLYLYIHIERCFY